jgi:glycosyltransferase involved in cell wall biosynthesis
LNACSEASGRPIVLTFVHYYLPGYKSGGPLRTISNMVEALGDEVDFRIVTSDRDTTDAVPYPNLFEGKWKKVGKAHVLYLPPKGKGLRRIAGILRETPHDVLYLNSFFDPDFTLKPLLARRLYLAPKTRCVIAPRGEFSEGALSIKASKKKLFLATTRPAGLYRELTWQASSEHEAADIHRVLGSVARCIKIAMDLSHMTPRPLAPFVPRAPGEPLRVVFLARISPMKNLDYALEVLAKVKVDVRFDIYGPIGDESYWSRCRETIARLPTHVEANYRGSVEHDRVPSVLAGYDLFFLPTKGENYGHVIHESLASGTPVLIADTTPWRNLREAGVGWDLSLEKPDDFVREISFVSRLTATEQIRARAQAAGFAESHRVDAAIVSANRELFMLR